MCSAMQNAWDTAFDTHVLHALSTSLSDHYPILLANQNCPRRPLCGWNGRNLNHAERLALVKSILTSQAVYFLTTLKVPKETLKEIDAKRKQFLWVGIEKLTREKCKVNWVRSARPTKNGGLEFFT